MVEYVRATYTLLLQMPGKLLKQTNSMVDIIVPKKRIGQSKIMIE